MESIEEIKEQLMNWLQKNKTHNVYKYLYEHLDHQSELYKTFVLLSGRYNELGKQRMVNLISIDDADRKAAILRNDLFDLISSLSDESINPQIANPKSPMIILFTQPDQKDELADFFKRLNLKEVIVSAYDQLNNCKFDAFKIVIFDNSDIPICYKQKDLQEMPDADQQRIKNRLQVMDAVIDNTNAFLIHYGNILYWVNQNREFVQAANSRFSLYARTKELVEFVNTFTV